MTQNRRQFIHKTAAGLAPLLLSPNVLSKHLSSSSMLFQSKPWIELSAQAYLDNAKQISQMAGGRPIVAVLKNNAYGVGVLEVAKILDQSSHVFGVAVVKDEVAIALRSGGVTKPILIMGEFEQKLGQELIAGNITLSIFSKDALSKVTAQSNKVEKPINVAVYLDTGLGRMGIPYLQAFDLIKDIANHPKLKITQTFSTLTTPKDFAEVQIERFNTLMRKLNKAGIDPGLTHLAPSYSLLDLPNSHKDTVRPGILLHGTFPIADMSEAETYPIQVSYRLKAPVMRLEKLKAGDTIGFSRFYKIEKEEWIATLPIGWADGYYSGAENGAKVLLGDQLYPVVNVNASHTNISLGSTTDVVIGDSAILIGPDRSEITPEGFAKLTDGHNYLQINYKESISKKVYETF